MLYLIVCYWGRLWTIQNFNISVAFVLFSHSFLLKFQIVHLMDEVDWNYHAIFFSLFDCAYNLQIYTQQTTESPDWIFDSMGGRERDRESVCLCYVKGYEFEVYQRKELSFYDEMAELSNKKPFEKLVTTA